MRQYVAVALFGALLSGFYGPAHAAEMIEVYKSAFCGCCTAWVDILRKEGFTVKTIDTENRSEIQQKAGLTPGQGSCHTAFIRGYALEGHVPPGAIRKLLAERPAIKGLTVPGMPQNSPGMGRMNGRLRTLEIGTGRVFSTD
jgi:hypothetical protein